MNKRNKILLGNKDIIARDIEDFYIDLELSSNKREIMPHKYDNEFDLSMFYNKERNTSNNFVVYGNISSYFCDCHNLVLNVYDDKSDNFILTTNSMHIVNVNMPFYNIYGKTKGRYMFKLPNFQYNSIYIKVYHENNEISSLIEENKFKQTLIYTTTIINNDGEKVEEKLEYGLNEVVTDVNGRFFEVNNDFDFFYNKHWVKKDLVVEKIISIDSNVDINTRPPIDSITD